MARVVCRTCGVEMLRPMNLWGVRELIHPDVSCIPLEQPERRLSQRWDVRACMVCGKEFAQVVKWNRPIKTCSSECMREQRARNLAKGRAVVVEGAKKGTPRPRTSPDTYKWAERYRRYWQKRAVELDAKWRKSA